MKQYKRIISYGIPRSGSTVIYQVLKHLFPASKIVKTHNFLIGSKIATMTYQASGHIFSGPKMIRLSSLLSDEKIVVTYRDFRDILVSQWRIQQSKGHKPYKRVDTSLIASPGRSGPVKHRKLSREDIYIWTAEVSKHIDVLDQYKELDKNKVLWMRYELFFNNFDYIFDKFSSYFNMTIDDSMRAKIKRECSLTRNIKIADKLKDFSEYDVENKIHGHHIFDGKIGGWERWIIPEYRKIVLEILGPRLKQYGYETDQFSIK